MDIFLQEEHTDKIIPKDTDTDKFQKIVSILCEKRRLIEESLARAEQTTLVELHQKLQELIDEMKSFGISEIDYQKYLAQQEKSNIKLNLV